MKLISLQPLQHILDHLRGIAVSILYFYLMTEACTGCETHFFNQNETKNDEYLCHGFNRRLKKYVKVLTDHFGAMAWSLLWSLLTFWVRHHVVWQKFTEVQRNIYLHLRWISTRLHGVITEYGNLRNCLPKNLKSPIVKQIGRCELWGVHSSSRRFCSSGLSTCMTGSDPDYWTNILPSSSRASKLSKIYWPLKMRQYVSLSGPG